MNTNKIMHCVLAADENYVAYASIAAISVLMNNTSSSFHIHLLGDNISEASKAKFRTGCEKFGAQVSIYDVAAVLDQNDFFKKQIKGYLSRTTFARLFLDSFISPSIHHILYIDCDVVCLGSLRELFQFESSLPVAGVVTDRLGNLLHHKERLGLKPDYAYFNAGVMFINLDAWRAEKIGEKATHFLANYPPEKIYYLDQDALNVVLADRVVEIGSKWNFQLNEISYEDADKKSAQGDIILAHFNGRLKPWQIDGYRKGSVLSSYQAAKNLSPWRFKFPEVRLIGRLKRNLAKKKKKSEKAHAVKSGETIHILYASDKNYLSFAGISMMSVVKNNKGNKIHFHFLADNIAPKELQKLSKWLQKAGADISIYEAQSILDKYAKDWYIPKYLSRTTYARLFLEYFLPEDMEQVIYVDSDTVCLGSLEALWDSGKKNVSVAAGVCDPCSNEDPAVRSLLKMAEGETYFNAGFLFVNLKGWREAEIGKKALACLNADTDRKLRNGDQDALNAVLHDKVFVLPNRYNFMLNEVEYENLPDVVIAHFTGRRKPWQIDGYRHGVAKRVFDSMKRKSPWRYSLPECRFLQRIKRSIVKRMPKWISLGV